MIVSAGRRPPPLRRMAELKKSSSATKGPLERKPESLSVQKKPVERTAESLSVKKKPLEQNAEKKKEGKESQEVVGKVQGENNFEVKAVLKSNVGASPKEQEDEARSLAVKVDKKMMGKVSISIKNTEKCNNFQKLFFFNHKKERVVVSVGEKTVASQRKKAEDVKKQTMPAAEKMEKIVI